MLALWLSGAQRRLLRMGDGILWRLDMPAAMTNLPGAAGEERAFRRRRLSRGLCVAALGLLLLGGGYGATTLAQSPCVGVADNGDFFRVTQPAGLEPLDAPRARGLFVQCEYLTVPADFTHFFSSAALAAWTAKHFAWGAADRMELRQMGLTWLTVLMAVLVFFVVSDNLSAIFAVAVLAVFLDPGYLLFFNSFYADPACMIPLAGCVLWLRRFGARRREFSESPFHTAAPWLYLLFALALCAGFSKMQYALFPGVLLAGLLPILLAPDLSWLRRAVVAGALVIATAAAVWHFSLGTGARFLEANNYHAVFAGMALVSSEPDQALAQLGIPAELRGLPRRDVWSAHIDPDHPIHAYLRNLSRRRLALLYLRDAGAIVRALDRIEDELALPRTHTRGNFPFSAEHPHKEIIDSSWRFGRVRSFLFGRWPWMLWLFLAGVVGWCGAAVTAQSARAGSVAPYVFLLVWFATQLVVVILGDGFVALEQHLIGARVALDLLLAVTGVELCLWLASAWRKTRSSREPQLTSERTVAHSSVLASGS